MSLVFASRGGLALSFLVRSEPNRLGDPGCFMRMGHGSGASFFSHWEGWIGWSGSRVLTFVENIGTNRIFNNC